jgi:lipoprotein-releasing system ATP-binding protein
VHISPPWSRRHARSASPCRGKSPSAALLLEFLDHPFHDGGFGGLGGLDARNPETLDDWLAELRLAELGFVFQSHFLLPEFSALENVMLPMQRLGRLHQAGIRARAEELLASLDLASEAVKLPRQLSGGQSQRVAIARALANDPSLILADEPTGNLDTASSKNVQTILKDLAHRHDRAVIVVTHDRDFAAAADRIVVVVDGKIRAS